LHNRRAFDEQLMQQFTLRIRNPHAMANSVGVIMIDLDKFKDVNDTYGHDAGDAVLIKLAQILNMTTRAEETIARYGGEEFMLLAPMTTPDELVKAADRIRATIELAEIQIPSGEYLKVTASFGAATMENPTTKDDAPQLIKAADEALYEAKSSGRNRVCLSRTFLPEV
jgi:diguanylate cyclase (GGDEF)-like protein